jgi:hypothetical protein
MTGQTAAARSAETAPLVDASVPATSSSESRLRAEGLVGVYAHRVLDRGGDLRAITADARAARFGAPIVDSERLVRARGPLPALPVGRGTERHRRALQTVPTRSHRNAEAAEETRSPRGSRRLVAAGVVALMLLPFAALIARVAEPALSGAASSSASERVVSAASASETDARLAGVARIAP